MIASCVRKNIYLCEPSMVELGPFHAGMRLTRRKTIVEGKNNFDLFSERGIE